MHMATVGILVQLLLKHSENQRLSIQSMAHRLEEASKVLNKIKDHDFSHRAAHLHPYKLLTALLTHAPANHEIAKDIIDNDREGNDVDAQLARLADYFWTNLLIPRKSTPPLLE
jgi:hypothetical protein